MELGVICFSNLSEEGEGATGKNWLGIYSCLRFSLGKFEGN